MSTPHLFFVAVALAIAAGALAILATQTPSLHARIESPPVASVSATSAPSPDLRAQMASLRDLHRRLMAGGAFGVTRELLVESQRVMGNGVSLMLKLRSGLSSAVSESGEVRRQSVTRAEADKITDFLDLMELLVQLKGDLEAIGPAATPSIDAAPSAVQIPPALPRHIKSLARADGDADWRTPSGSPVSVCGFGTPTRDTA